MTLLCTCSRPAQTAPISRPTASGSTAILSSRSSSNKAWHSAGTAWPWHHLRLERVGASRVIQAARINRRVLGCRPTIGYCPRTHAVAVRLPSRRCQAISTARQLCAASSTDRCNTFCELLSRCLIEQGLSRPFIELPCDSTELGLAVQGQIGATRKILAQQSVGVFV